MPELTFSDPQKGIVKVKGLQVYKGFAAKEASVRFTTWGLELSHWQGPYPPQEGPWLLTWQAFTLIFESTSKHFQPPFTFSLQGAKLHHLPTEGIKSDLYVAQVPAHLTSGYTEVRLSDAKGRLLWQWETEIFPHLFGYHQHDQVMIRQLQQAIYGLAFHQPQTTYLPVEPKRAAAQPLPMVIQRAMEQLPQALHHLDRNISSLALRHINSQPIHIAQRYPARIQPTHQLVRQRGLPYHVPDLPPLSQLPLRQTKASINHPLNQWLAQYIRSVLRLWQQHTDPSWIAFRQVLQQYLAKWTHQGLQLPEVPLPPPSHLPPDYQALTQLIQSLSQRFDIWENGLFRQSYKMTATLYEYWCFVQLIHLLGDLTQSPLTYQDVVMTHGPSPLLRLSQGQAVHVTWKLPQGPTKLALWYQPRLAAADGSTIQTPDFLLELYKPGFRRPFWFLFEAKYRLHSPTEVSGPPADSLDQLHRYRDRIQQDRLSLPDREAALKVIGGAVLFPYPAAVDTFVFHPTYQSLNRTQIGALPLCPGQYQGDRLLREFLAQLIYQPAEALFEQIVDYDRREQQVMLNAFAVQLTILPVDAELPKDAGILHWQNQQLIQYRLPGESRWQPIQLDVDSAELPTQTNLGLLRQALAYRRVDILSLPDYRAFRLWQELFGLDPQVAAWPEGKQLNFAFVWRGHHFRARYKDVESEIALIFPDGRKFWCEYPRQIADLLPNS